MIYVWAIAIYLALLIGMSACKSCKVKTQENFMAAGLFLGEFQI